VEGAESAVKLARRWAYDVKRIPKYEAKILFAKGNFWGRSIAAVSASTDPAAFTGYGPFLPGFFNIPYNDLNALETSLKDPNVAAFMIEPVQGEAGVVVPDKHYLKKAHDLCKKNKVLLITDEVQTGLGRTGKMMCYDYDQIKPDLVVLGKALSGGIYPVSAVLGNDEVMLTIKPGEHGSTYGGNPLACAIARKALEVLIEEKLTENSFKMGELFRSLLRQIQKEFPQIINTVRGLGLLNAIVIHKQGNKTAMDVCLSLARKGLLAKPTHQDIIRLAPPLTINEEQINQGADLIRQAIKEYSEK